MRNLPRDTAQHRAPGQSRRRAGPVLPGLTSCMQELPWAGAQRDAQHLHLHRLPWWQSPWGAWWSLVPRRTCTLVQTTCGEDPLHRRHSSTTPGGDLADAGGAGQRCYHHRHVTVTGRLPLLLWAQCVVPAGHVQLVPCTPTN